jgi:competence protein ComEC
MFVVTQKINFHSYLKGFYTKSFNITKLENLTSKKEYIYNTIASQHSSKSITSLYSALYLATPLNSQIRELASNLGISHLIAISGFHLGLMSLVLYFIIHLLYSKIHKVFVPYRNKRFDIMIIVTIILFAYLLFLDFPASLLRAFVMFVFALFLLRSNIKLISFETLFIISIFIIALFPKLLFSLSLWFSIAGVFYIFLFLKYFNNIHKYLQFFMFNFWIFLAINPIVHYFFPTTTIEQLYSPILTILFSLFYPVSVLLHFLNLGGILDGLLQYLIHVDIKSIEVYTPLWVFVTYLLISFFSIFNKKFFIVLNIYLILYNVWLFQSTFKEYLFIGI